MKNTKKSVGVVVGRFQVPTLHRGHKHLLATASLAHDELLVVLGSAAFPTPRNPLSFEMRRSLIHTHYPNATVLEIKDCRTYEEWAETLDRLISTQFPKVTVVLYGSRDSFIPHYSGHYKTEEVEEVKGYSGTLMRAETSREPSTIGFRNGVIHGYNSRLAVTRPMVDMAVVRGSEVLLGGKKADPAQLWRFPGGLVDQTDASLEAAAKRELSEEVSNIEVSDLTYVGSRQISDWRYHGTGERGLTTLFRAYYINGKPKAGDDLNRVAWKPLASFIDHLVEEHKPLGEMLLKSLEKKHETT